MLIKRLYSHFILFLSMLGIVGSVFLGCDILSKQDLPEGHTDLKGGVFHSEGANQPFKVGKNSCNASECHGEELLGGVAEVKGKKLVAPSCFQCHGKLWRGSP